MENHYKREGRILTLLQEGRDGGERSRFVFSVMPNYFDGVTEADGEAEAERIKQAVNNYYQALQLLAESRNQIEYLHRKFQQTGSGNAILARIDSFLEKMD